MNGSLPGIPPHLEQPIDLVRQSPLEELSPCVAPTIVERCKREVIRHGEAESALVQIVVHLFHREGERRGGGGGEVVHVRQNIWFGCVWTKKNKNKAHKKIVRRDDHCCFHSGSTYHFLSLTALRSDLGKTKQENKQDKHHAIHQQLAKQVGAP